MGCWPKPATTTNQRGSLRPPRRCCVTAPPVAHHALAGGADDKAQMLVQQGLQKFLAIAATIHRPDAAAVEVLVRRVDYRENLSVFAHVFFALGREQLLTYRHDVAAVHFGCGHVHQPVASMCSPVEPSQTVARCSIFWAYYLRISLRSSASTVSALPERTDPRTKALAAFSFCLIIFWLFSYASQSTYPS